MEKSYWIDRWERIEIGFHQDDVNAYLKQHWKTLDLAPGSEVFVPLCGKSSDMLWLREQGHSVLGVEISTIAVRAFFQDNHFTPYHDTSDKKFDRFGIGDINILCGDFFDLNSKNVAKVAAVYDRASLVALPPEMRKHYAHHLMRILSPGTQILLVTFDYPQSEMQGPPFAVSPNEVDILYRKHAEINQLAQFDVLAQNPRFQDRGLSRIQESIFLLIKQ